MTHQNLFLVLIVYTGSGCPTITTPAIVQIVERQMHAEDETMAVQLQKGLVDRGHSLSLKMILASHCQLGWTFCGSAHCQIIHNKSFWNGLPNI